MQRSIEPERLGAHHRRLCAFVAAVLAACTGSIPQGEEDEPSAGRTATAGSKGKAGANGQDQGAGGATSTTPPTASACDELRRDGPEARARARVRRLTRTELRGALEAIVGGPWTGPELPADLDARGILKDADVLTIRDEFMTSYWPVTESAADRVLAGAQACAATDQACARAFASNLGQRAWRRDLTDAEISALVAAFDKGAAIDSATGMRFVVQRVLLSPSFLYLHEDGAFAADPTTKPLRLSPARIAEQLAFFLTSAPPDATLSAAAKAGKLATTAGIREQASRLLGEARARAAIGDLFEAWLSLGAVRSAPKSQAMFPMLSDDLRTDMAEDSRRTLAALMFDQKADVSALAASPTAFVTPRLARFLGKSAPMGATDQAPVAGDLIERRGLLTHPAFLTVASKEDQTSTVIRGKLATELLLCAHVPDPPAGVDLAAADPMFAPDLTMRERMDRHAKDPACSACHKLFEPIGFALEGYDPVGRKRTMDAGKPINDRVVLKDFHGVSGDFAGIGPLAEALAKSPAIESCFVAHVARHALGRAPTPETACVAYAAAGLAEDKQSGRSMNDLVLDYVTSPAFLERTPAALGGN